MYFLEIINLNFAENKEDLKYSKLSESNAPSSKINCYLNQN
jgi:hypothetical protein